MRRVATACTAALLALPAALCWGQAPSGTGPPATREAGSPQVELSVSQYAGQLAAIAQALRGGDRAGARASAEALKAARIVWQEEALAPDRGLLDETARVNTPAAAYALASRIERLAGAVRSAAPEETVVAHPEALARVTRRDDLAAGGSVDAHLSPPPLNPSERLLRLLDVVRDWATSGWKRIEAWLKRLWPRPRSPVASAAQMSRTTVVVLIAVGLATLLILLLAARAMAKPVDVVAESDAPQAAARRDDDPLSREPNEWERYAEELAAAGRRRESIRAWYHAVLTTLFRTGVLHYAKGRTNWEYVSDLSADLRWRATFVSLTRGFDVEWYGRDVSSPQVLAVYARDGRSVLRALGAGQAHA
jgi:hypothetical protein